MAFLYRFINVFCVTLIASSNVRTLAGPFFSRFFSMTFWSQIFLIRLKIYDDLWFNAVFCVVSFFLFFFATSSISFSECLISVSVLTYYIKGVSFLTDNPKHWPELKYVIFAIFLLFGREVMTARQGGNLLIYQKPLDQP